jgi:hypothetical protein
MLHDQVDQRVAAQLMRQRPCLRLGEVHQRGFDAHRPAKAERQSLRLSIQRVAAAIGIAGIIRLAHAADQHVDPAPHGESRGDGEEDQIACGHEGGRQAVFAEADLSLSRQRAFSQIPIAGDVHHSVFAQARRPIGKASTIASRTFRRALISTPWRWP